MKPIEQRKSQRINLQAPIEITLSSGETLICETYDFSDSGLYVVLPESEHNKFPAGSEVKVQFQGLNYTPPVLNTEVVRHDDRGIGLLIRGTFKPGEL